jgi:GPH family glycoside/pentoside/hexuronide:cation symporter
MSHFHRERTGMTSTAAPNHGPTSTFHKMMYGLGNLPTGLLSGVMGAWLMFYYCPPEDAGRTIFVAPQVFGFWLLVLSIPSALADPIVGHFSDRTRSRWGRRIPYILFGTPVLMLSFVFMWFPPVRGLSATNTVWLAGSVLVYYLAFTAVVNPLLAIMPEVWQSEKDRMTVSSLMSIASAIGTLLSSVAGVVIEAIPDGPEILGVGVNGFRLTALICGGLTLATLAPTVFWIRETPHSESKEVPYNIIRSGWQTLKNPAFLPYILAAGLVNTSTTLVIGLLPYLVTVVAKSSEGVAGALMGGLMILAMLFLPLVNKVVEKVTRRMLFLMCCVALGAVLAALYFTGFIPETNIGPVPARVLFMGALLLLAAPFVSVFLVVPRTLLADVMDYDERLTGYRREAMYNGMESLIGKVPVGLAPWIMGELFTRYGNTMQRTEGIALSAVAAGILTFAAWAVFLTYPLRK